MDIRTFSPLPQVFLAFVLFSIAGCAGKESPLPAQLPRLALNCSFKNDLSLSGQRGLKGVTLVAPASGPTEQGAREMHHLAEEFGVNLPRRAINPEHVPYNANSDEMRLNLLASALVDPDTEVVWAVRGGYGSSRLLNGLARRPLPALPKIFIGYSDMTFIHLFLQKQGWQTVHGSMFGEMNNPVKDEANFLKLAALLAGKHKVLRYEGLKPVNRSAMEASLPIRGSLTGGNLTCIAAASGTPWALDAAGKILFLEDVKEPGYKIDRMLTQLESAGLLRDVKAVILGSFSLGDANTEFALKRFAENFAGPVFQSDLFGHGAKNYPLVFNAPAVLARSGDKETHQLSIRADLLP